MLVIQLFIRTKGATAGVTRLALVQFVLDFASFLEDFRGLFACSSEVRFSL